MRDYRTWRFSLYYMQFYWRHDGKPKQGYIFSIFLIFLFTVRFFIEFFKEVQVSFEAGMTLNMGQWLSIPFILAGFVLLYRTYKKNPVQPEPGRRK
jgi:phosphatidylglycerol---prolipoprotein diacylglyceryl transferase